MKETVKMAAPIGLVLGAVFIRSGWKWPSAAEPYRKNINRASGRYSVPATLLARLLYEESRFRADIVTGKTRSSAGALGIAQFMPATASALGIDPLNPSEAIDGAARYLASLKKRFKTWRLALIAYNWGPGNVSKNLQTKEFAPSAVEYADSIIKDAL